MFLDTRFTFPRPTGSSGAFRLFSKLAFSEDLNRGDAGKKRMQKPGKPIPDAGVFRIKCKSLTVLFLPASLRVSALKLFTDFSKSARNKRAKRPASEEVSADHRSDKYQSTRNSQLSAFGLTFQIFQICEEYQRDWSGLDMHASTSSAALGLAAKFSVPIDMKPIVSMSLSC